MSRQAGNEAGGHAALLPSPALLAIHAPCCIPAPSLLPCHRPDGSTFHLLKYDPRTGKLRWQGTHQGYADNSTWSRGQAWALTGFTHFYNATRDPGMLATACRAADTYLRLLGESGEEDWMPLWDFQAPASQASQPAVLFVDWLDGAHHLPNLGSAEQPASCPCKSMRAS